MELFKENQQGKRLKRIKLIDKNLLPQKYAVNITKLQNFLVTNPAVRKTNEKIK